MTRTFECMTTMTNTQITVSRVWFFVPNLIQQNSLTVSLPSVIQHTNICAFNDQMAQPRIRLICMRERETWTLCATRISYESKCFFLFVRLLEYCTTIERTQKWIAAMWSWSWLYMHAHSFFFPTHNILNCIKWNPVVEFNCLISNGCFSFAFETM